MSKYIDSEKLIAELTRMQFDLNAAYRHPQSDSIVRAISLEYDDVISLVNSLQQEQPKKRLIQVKCLYPYDESWQKNKVYTCEVWHHGDLNRDFWDVYYDYGKDPRYVQFTSIELLNEEFVVIQDQPEVDLDKDDIIDYVHSHFYYDKDFDGYGHSELRPVFTRDDVEVIARHFYELGLAARRGE